MATTSDAAAARPAQDPSQGQPLVIANGRVLTDSTAATVLADIWISDGTIRRVGRPGEFDAIEGALRIDAADRLIIPGLVNGHTHAHGALGRGAVPDVGLEGFLAASPSIHGQRSVSDMALSAQLTAVELLEHGCTAVFDMTAEFPATTLQGLHAVADAYRQAGLRAVVAPMVADRTLYQAYPELLAGLPAAIAGPLAAVRAPDGPGSLDVVHRATRDWPFDSSFIRLGLGPTIPLHATDPFLKACAELSEACGLPMQTHLAESRTQATFGAQRYGRSLVAHLAGLGFLSERLSVAHAIWIDEADIRQLADAGVTAIHNPLSNLRLGSGVAPVRRMLEAGLTVGLGTDGPNTSDTQNLFEAMRLAAGLSRIVGDDESRWIRGAEALHMATEGSARSLGPGFKLGRIEAGYAADLVLVDLGRATYVPLRDPLRQLVHGEDGTGVDRVLVGGRTVVDRGRILTVDKARLRQEAQQAAERLDALNAEGANLARALRPWVGGFCCSAASRPFGVARRLSL
jgi:guanine deaminase